MIADLTVDSQNDAKGSAGDKHETALSIMISNKKLNHKLQEIYAHKQVLDQIDPLAVHQKVALGSVVLTNGMWLFMSAALPKVLLTKKQYLHCHPIAFGELLMGQSIGQWYGFMTNPILSNKYYKALPSDLRNNVVNVRAQYRGNVMLLLQIGHTII